MRRVSWVARAGTVVDATPSGFLPSALSGDSRIEGLEDVMDSEGESLICGCGTGIFEETALVRPSIVYRMKRVY